jgi:NADPH-dependent 2,4-dienoyl-CoA reductase/sulfur reductase-like enzyme
MQTALVATLRGHEVTLFEESGRLGGQIRLAARASARRELAEVCDWLERELARTGVDVRARTRAEAGTLREFDAVVLATGSTPDRSGYASFRPAVHAVPGHDLQHVLTAFEVLEQPERAGERVVVLEDDPHVQGTTVAELLAEAGRRVTIVSRNQQVGLSIGAVSLEFLYKRLFRAGIELVDCTWVDEIRSDGVRCSNVYSGAESFYPAETVVLCTGNIARDELYGELKDSGVELHRVGDCLAPRKLDNAIWDGFHAGRAL